MPSFKPLALGLLTALALLAPAGAAMAAVDDQSGILSPDAKAHLEQDLGQWNHHHFDVVFVDHAADVKALAQTTFRQHRLGSGDGMIAVAVKDHHVGVHLGQGFTQHGVDGAVIGQHLKSDFNPDAKAGHFDLATSKLAGGLMQEANAHTTTTTTSRTHTSTGVAPTPDVPHHAGFPWGIFLFIAALGGGVWWWIRRSNTVSLAPRVKELERQHAAIVASALRLDEVDTLGRFREGDVAEQYKKLGKRSAELMGESRDFGEKLLEAGELVKKGKSKDAEPLLAQLEGRATGLQAEVAASLTTLDRLEGTTGLKGDEGDLPKLVNRLSRRYSELKAAYAELQRRAPGGLNRNATVESRLAGAEQLLTTVPVDAKEAEQAIVEATDALDDYRRSIDGEADREAVRQGGWSNSPSYLPYMSLPIGYNRPYFYTSYYEPPIVVYNEVGGGWGGSGGGYSGSDASSGWGSGDSSSWNDNERQSSGSDASGGWDSGGSDSVGGWDSGGGDSGGGGDW